MHAQTVAPAGFPPGPPPLNSGIVTAARFLWGMARDPLGTIRARFDRYGDVYSVANAGARLFVFRHPDAFREVLVTRASSFGKTHTAFRQLATVLGDGLLVSDGETWKRQRRMIAPAFLPARLAEYARVMTEESVRTTERWRDGDVLDVGHEMTELTLRIVARALFGHDVGDDAEKVSRAMAAFQQSLAGLGAQLLPAWLPTPSRRASRRGLQEIDRIIYALIARAKSTGKQGDSSNLLHALVSAVDVEGDGGMLDDREVRDQLVTMFLAGHETTAHALTWTLYLLSQNETARSKACEEIDRVVGDRAPAYDDLSSLPYLEQVVHESMRIYPPVYLLARAANEDVTLSSAAGGWHLPKGSEVILWTYFAHHDARWFDDPASFRPERFAPERANAMTKLAYLPFGGGPRACIGKSFALIEARLALATILRKFRLDLVPGHRVAPKMRITMMPKHGMKMIARAR